MYCGALHVLMCGMCRLPCLTCLVNTPPPPRIHNLHDVWAIQLITRSSASQVSEYTSRCVPLWTELFAHVFLAASGLSSAPHEQSRICGTEISGCGKIHRIIKMHFPCKRIREFSFNTCGH